MVFSMKGVTPWQMRKPRCALPPWADIAPCLTEITDTVPFDDVWRRPGLSPRDRSLITVASLIALYRSNELKFHLGRRSRTA
jgi:alkylhydroperoxidase/carboxymuconolactone decarboxylase family protein YurZ